MRQWALAAILHSIRVLARLKEEPDYAAAGGGLSHGEAAPPGLERSPASVPIKAVVADGGDVVPEPAPVALADAAADRGQPEPAAAAPVPAAAALGGQAAPATELSPGSRRRLDFAQAQGPHIHRNMAALR